MVFRTSYRGLVIWFLASGALALLGLAIASSESDELCSDFGYVRSGSFTCEASSGLRLAYFFGGNCLLAGLSLAWASYKNSRTQTDMVHYTSRGGLGSANYADFRTSTLESNSEVTRYDSEGQRIRSEVADGNDVARMATEQTWTDSEGQVVKRVEVPSEEVQETVLEVAQQEQRSSLEYLVTYEKREKLKFSYVNQVSYGQLVDAISAATSSFRVTQETLTGLRLASLMKDGGNA